MTDYWNCPHVHDAVLHVLPVKRLVMEFCDVVCFILVATSSMTQMTHCILFLKDSVSGQLRKHWGWKWGGRPRDQSLQESFPGRPQWWPWRTWGWWRRGKKMWAERIIQTDAVVQDTKPSRRLLLSCQPFFLTRYQDILVQQFVFPNRVSSEF